MSMEVEQGRNARLCEENESDLNTAIFDTTVFRLSTDENL